MPSQLSLPGVAAPVPATDRLFFALLPDPTAAQEIHHCARDIQHAQGPRSRLTETNRLHLSLQHLGDHAGVPASRVDAARRAASGIDFPAFDLFLDRVLTFTGHGQKAGSLPCVMTATSDVSVHRLHRALGVAMRTCGLGVQSWTSTPHVTMLYAPKVVDERPIEPICFRVREFVMVHAFIRTKRPYELLGRWPLRG